MRNFFTSWWFIVAVIVSATVAIFLKPYGIVGFPVIIILLSIAMPRVNRVSSLLFHNIFLYVILSCVIQVLGIIFWLLNIGFTYELFVALLAIFVIGLYMARRRKLDYTTLVHKDDVVPGIIAIVAMGVMVIGILHGGGAAQQLLRYITGGFDARQHISMTISDYDYHGYVLGYSDKISKELVYTSLGSYPQGWHLNTAFLMSSISNHLTFLNNYKQILVIFFAAIILWYGLVTFLVGRATLYVIRALRNVPSSIAYALSISVSVLIQLTLLVNVIKNGFANFLPALAYLIVLVILGVWLHHTASSGKKAPFLIYGLLLMAGTAFSWSLAAPMAGLLVIAYWLIGFDGWVEVVRWLRNHTGAVLTSLILIFLSTIPFIQALTDKEYSVSHHINDAGGIWTISFVFLAIVFSGAMVVVLKLNQSRLRLSLLATLLLPTLVYAVVNMYQFYSTGVSTYFSTKVLSLVLVIVVILFGATLAPHIQAVAGSVKKSVLVFLIISIGLLLPPLTSYDLSGLQLFKNGSSAMSIQTANTITTLLDKKSAFSSNVFLMQDTSADVTATLLVESMSRTYPGCIQSFVGDTITGKRENSLKDIIACSQIYPQTTYYVISSHSNNNELNTYFAPYSNITVIPSA